MIDIPMIGIPTIDGDRDACGRPAGYADAYKQGEVQHFATSERRKWRVKTLISRHAGTACEG